MILQIERAVFGKDTDMRFLACTMKFRKWGVGIPFGLTIQNLQQRKEVVDCAMAILEKAGLPDQIAKLGAFEATCRPIDLRIRTSSGLIREVRRERLAERTIEAGVMGDDKIGQLDQCPHGLHVYHLASHHLIRNASELCDLGWNGDRRLLQAATHPSHRQSYPARQR